MTCISVVSPTTLPTSHIITCIPNPTAYLTPYHMYLHCISYPTAYLTPYQLYLLAHSLPHTLSRVLKPPSLKCIIMLYIIL